jgi:ribonuclease D
VFSENDIRAFQRDFELLMIGVVDLQSVFQSLNGYPQRNDYSFVVNNLLEVKLDKSMQFFPWSLRPLPKDALEYARNDTKYLIRSWNKIKALYDVEDINLSVSKKEKLACTPFLAVKKKNFLSDFDFAIKQVKLTKNLDCNSLKGKQDLFETIWNWREFVAKSMDKNPKTLLCALEIAKITILSPKDVCSLKNISKIVCQVDDAYLRQLLGLLSNLRETTPFGETHKRETTPLGETHGMEGGEGVKDKADSTNNCIEDDTIELMVDDSTIEFVNRSENQEEKNIPLDKLYITNPIR